MDYAKREDHTPEVLHEGWMVRYGRRKIGKSFIHSRYFVLQSNLLSYYKKKPTEKNKVPLKTLAIDGNFRVEDKGMRNQHNQTVYVLCVYNKKEKHQRITMAAADIQDALLWKEKIELVIDQQQHESLRNGNKISISSDFAIHTDENASSTDQESHPEDEDIHPAFLQENLIENGPPDSVYDWTREPDMGLSNEANTNQLSRKRWRLVRCQNGLRIFEELLEVDYLPRSCSRAMKAIGIVDASCESVFQLVMRMDSTRFEWDCSFEYGSLVDEVDGHTAILYHRLQLEWFQMFVWPRDLCYVRYWRRTDDGSYVVLFQSREHPNCSPKPGFVRAHIESGGFKISPFKSGNGRPRTHVQHLMQIDLKGWFMGYFPSFQHHCLLQMLNSVAGMREYFAAATDEMQAVPTMVDMSFKSVPPRKVEEANKPTYIPSLAQVLNDNGEDDYEEDEETQVHDAEQEACLSDNEIDKSTDDEPLNNIDLSGFSGTLRQDDNENGRNCWRIPEAENFKVRSKSFTTDKSKVPAGEYLMQLVAVDWLKGPKRLDHVVRRRGCAAEVAAEKGLFTLVINLQVPGSTHYSMVFYFVMKQLVNGSLLQQLVNGDDEYRNSRLKLIPSVRKGSWIVRQSVGSTACLLGKALDCTYIRGATYLEIDVDIGSSTVANGVLGLVFGVISSLVVDLAFLVQAVTAEELPEMLFGAVQICHVELSSAEVAEFED